MYPDYRIGQYVYGVSPLDETVSGRSSRQMCYGKIESIKFGRDIPGYKYFIGGLWISAMSVTDDYDVALLMLRKNIT